MLDYQIAAINAVREYAKSKEAEYYAFVESICKPFNLDVDILIKNILSKPITVNFHPDRFSNNGNTIIENLLHDGQYKGQFHTGTSNGGRTAYVGGDRFHWEQRLFFNAYPKESKERPKYGALNLLRYLDGASARFGSCYFTLNPNIINRCTYAYGDSSTNPTTLCTGDTFVSVVAGLFEDVRQNHRLLNKVIATEQEALAVLMNPDKTVCEIGRNLDYCIETHIHGDVSLADDVDLLYVDESFVESDMFDKIELLCYKYRIELKFIPKRQVYLANIGELFRGPKIPILASKIDNLLGNNKGIINANLIGSASRDSLENPKNWQDIGNEYELFQYFKQLWHTLAFFG